MPMITQEMANAASELIAAFAKGDTSGVANAGELLSALTGRAVYADGGYPARNAADGLLNLYVAQTAGNSGPGYSQ